MKTMTWKRALQIGTVVGVLGMLAVASGAGWVDSFAFFF